jgi:hypothetical protein
MDLSRYLLNQTVMIIIIDTQIHDGLPKNLGNLTLKIFLSQLLVSTVSFEVVPLGMYTELCTSILLATSSGGRAYSNRFGRAV